MTAGPTGRHERLAAQAIGGVIPDYPTYFGPAVPTLLRDNEMALMMAAQRK
jgi:hypothetical protein